MNINRNIFRSFSNNHKPGSKPHPYKKQNNSFPPNKNFNKPSAWPNVPAPNSDRPTLNEGAKVFSLQVSCWKCQGPHYASDFQNKTNGFLHNLQEDPIVEDMDSTPRIYAKLKGQ